MIIIIIIIIIFVSQKYSYGQNVKNHFPKRLFSKKFGSKVEHTFTFLKIFCFKTNKTNKQTNKQTNKTCCVQVDPLMHLSANRLFNASDE